MNNTQMREFLEKDLADYKKRAEREKDYTANIFINALDKAVHDVRILRENTKWTAQTIHMTYHNHAQTVSYLPETCKTGICDAATYFLKETEWAEKRGDHV